MQLAGPSPGSEVHQVLGLLWGSKDPQVGDAYISRNNSGVT